MSDVSGVDGPAGARERREVLIQLVISGPSCRGVMMWVWEQRMYAASREDAGGRGTNV
jgi:hypothetical protein